MGMRGLSAAIGLAAVAAAPVQALAQEATAELVDVKGTPVGTAQLNQLEQYQWFVRAHLETNTAS